MIDNFLDQDQSLYHKLFLLSPSVGMLIDAVTGKIVEANNAAVNFYGYSAQELGSMKISDLGLLDERVVLQHMHTACWQDGNCFRNQHRLKNGEIRDVGIYSSRININGRELIYALIIDLSMSLRIKDELQQRKEQLAMVIESAKAGIWDWDMAADRVYYDRNWKAALGYEDHEIGAAFDEWQSRWHPEEAESITRAMQNYLEGKSDKYELEHRLRHKDGSYRWILASGKITRDESGKPLRWVGLNIDITAQKELVQARLDSEKKLRDFAQAIPDMSAIIDEDGLYVEVFGRAETSRVNGIELQGRTLHEVFPEELADRMLRDIRDTIQTGRTNSFIREIELGLEKGCFEGRTSPMGFVAQGKKTAAVIVSDISYRLKVERKLQFAYELQRRSDFINDVISENIYYDEKMVESAAKWGIDFTKPLYCSLIDIKARINTCSEGEVPDVQACKDKVLFALGGQEKYIVWDNQDKIGILCQDIPPDDYSIQNTITEAEAINQRIQSLCAGLQVTIGISDIHHGPSSIQKSYQEAWNTLISAQCQNDKAEGIYHFRDMGLFQILTTFCGNSDTSGYVYKTIGSLIDYDQEKGTDFLVTLEEILQGNNLKETAQKMFIHHKTLVFRKQRIEKILGVSLEQFETRLALAAAIKLYKLGNVNK